MLPRYSYKIGLEQVKVDQPLEAFVRALAAAGVPLPADIRACLAQLTPGQSVLTPAYSVRRTDGVPPDEWWLLTQGKQTENEKLERLVPPQP